MKLSIILILALVTFSLADLGDILSTIPAPAGNPDGLVWIDDYLWITSDVTYMIYKIDPSTGAALDSMPGLGSDCLTGLTYDGEYLLVCDHPWIYYRDLATGDVVDSIPPPNSQTNEGLAWDVTSNTIWSTNWRDNLVYEVDPETGTILDYFFPQNPGKSFEGLTGLAFDGFFLWITDQNTQSLMRMLPGDPWPWDIVVLSTIATPQDLAWDGTSLWVTEYEVSGAQVYQIDPGEGALTPATWGNIKSEF